jgi:uncharacterized protein with HEPN domain
MNAADLARLHHMLDAAREAILFTEGRDLEDLRQDRMLLLSLVKEIEIIGEAASRISPEGRAAIAGIPWLQMMAMRNRLTHGYFDWDTETIWATVTSDLPNLVRVLEQAISPLSRASEPEFSGGQ